MFYVYFLSFKKEPEAKAKTLPTDNYSSSSFWKGTLPPYRETIDTDDNSIASPNSFHSIEDDGERDGSRRHGSFW
jgi:hypothetical protein